MPQEMPRVLTLDEAAEILRLSRRTTARLLESGRLRGVRAGRVWRIPREAIDEFLRGEGREKGDEGQE